MGIVSIARCDEYEINTVRAAVRQALAPLGGIESFVKPGDKVLLKVNLLIRRAPEKVTTTHPSMAQALAELVQEAGGIPMIGDSPGGYHFYTESTLKNVYDTCGMTRAAQASGAKLNYNTDMIDVAYPSGKMMKTIKTIKPVLEADKIISIPKIKTHMMTVYSGAVKNLFGVIPGSFKAEYHLRFEDKYDFADLLIDICSFAKPVLSVMDAIMGMEGYGPTAGSPKKVGLVIAGESPYEIDYFATQIIGLKPAEVPTVMKSVERGFLKKEEAELAGAALGDVLVRDFKKPTRQFEFNYYSILLPKFVRKPLEKYIKPKPVFDLKKCVGCGACQRSCPPKAIRMAEGKPVLNLNECIRCFCCHELCNYEAIKVKKPWFLKLLLR